MSITLQNYRDYVRNYLDVDASDVPDSLVDMWVRECQSLILRSKQHWAHLFTTTTIVSVSGTANYAVAGIEEVRGVQGPQWELDPIDPVYGDRRYTPNIVDSSDPIYWSNVSASPTTYVTTIKLWPTPVSALTYTVRGYRPPADPALTNNTSPDLPDDFHPIMSIYVAMRACQQQNDYYQAQMIAPTFENSMRELLAYYDQQGSHPDGTIMNVPRRYPSRYPRLRFPFEPPFS